MLQSRAISEASSPSFLSESLWWSIERAFKFKGLYFDFDYIMAEMLHAVMATTGHVIQHHRLSRCATKIQDSRFVFTLTTCRGT